MMTRHVGLSVFMLLCCAACAVQGLGFVNPTQFPNGFFDTGNNPPGATDGFLFDRFELFSDLFYTPQVTTTVLPLRDYILVNFQSFEGINPFDASAQFEAVTFWTNVEVNDPTDFIGTVVSIGPDVQQRELFHEGAMTTSFQGDGSSCQIIVISSLLHLLCREREFRGVLSTGVNTAEVQKLAQYQGAQRLFTPTLNGVVFNGRDINA